MIDRVESADVMTRLREFPAVAVYGARQVGKTTLARQIAREVGAVYFDLENPKDRLLFENPTGLFREHENRLIIIDEAQRLPDLFPALRVVIDARARAGQFLLLGSASPALSRQSAESLAGRLAVVELPPLLCTETGATAPLERLWIRGGFPRSFLAGGEQQSLSWRKEFLRSFIERDLRMLGFDLPPVRMERFLTMLAHTHGQLWNAAHFARSLNIGATTAGRYLDALAQTYMVTVLTPYFANVGKRLRKAPKVFLTDSGLAHALLDIAHRQALLSHPVAGFSWEGFVMRHLKARLPFGWECSFWRTAAGAEIDVLVLRAGRPFIAVEAKLNPHDPKPRRGFTQGCTDLNIERRWLINPGEQETRLTSGVHILPLPRAMQQLDELTGPSEV